MKLLVISHKEVWPHGSGYGTSGGFPLQVAALADLFDHTLLIATLRREEPPGQLQPLLGRGLSVQPLPEPRGRGMLRKILLSWWLVRHLPRLWRSYGAVDAVHALVPGDVGLLGLLLARWRKKPLFVRHCGTWGHRATVADRFLAWLLPRIARGKTVVMATGGGSEGPSQENPRIGWIFSTTLTEGEIASLPTSPPWQPGTALRLVTVARLSRGKNTLAILEALPQIRRVEPSASLHIVGDGPLRGELEARAAELELGDAVFFCGNLPHDEVLERLSRCHLFVFPTRVAEGFPKAVLEAMACGLPVIAPPVSVLSSLLANGRGVLLGDCDADAVARACLSLIEDPESMGVISQAARSEARRYTLEGWKRTIAERLEQAWGPLREAGAEQPVVGDLVPRAAPASRQRGGARR